MHTRLPGLRQGTTVCVHTSMDMERQSDHKLITPSGMGLLVCGAGSHPSCHLGVVRGNVPTGVNLHQYAGPGSLFRWHSDNEPLFGPQYLFTQVQYCLSLGNFVEFMVRRRAPGDVPSSIRLDHGDILSWMVWPNRSVNIARRLGCRVLGLTLPTAGLHNTLRPALQQAQWVVCSQRVRKVCRARFPLVWRRRK